MPKPTAQACHALTTYFVSSCEEAGTKVTVNRNKARWGFESILMDYSPVAARELIDYYTSKYTKPNLDWFLYNYDKVDEEKQDAVKNELLQSERRKQTQERLEKWRNRSWQ